MNRRKPVSRGLKGLGECLPKPGDGTTNDPFQTYDRTFSLQQQSPMSVFGASPIAGGEDLKRREEASGQMPIAISLPPHFYIPADAQSIDISALANVPPATTVSLLRFEGLAGGLTKFLGYAVFNDALALSSIVLTPTVNGERVFPLHGNPQLKFKMGLGLGPDMATLIPCQLDLQPGQVLEWMFTNNDVVDVAVGVRMNGYFSQDIKLKQGRFGG